MSAEDTRAWVLRRGLTLTASELGVSPAELLAILATGPTSLDTFPEYPVPAEYVPLTGSQMDALQIALASADDAHVVRAPALDLADMHDTISASTAAQAVANGTRMRPEARPFYAAELLRRFPEGVVGGATVWAYAPEACDRVPRIVITEGRYGT